MVKSYGGKSGNICCRNWNLKASLSKYSHCTVCLVNQEILFKFGIKLMILWFIDETKRKKLLHSWALNWQDFTNQPIDDIYSHFGTKVSNWGKFPLVVCLLTSEQGFQYFLLFYRSHSTLLSLECTHGGYSFQLPLAFCCRLWILGESSYGLT